MDYTEIWRRTEEQLAVDYGCSPEDLRSGRNVVRPLRQIPGARPAGGDGCMLRIAVINEVCLVMAADELLDWCRDFFDDLPAAWLSEPAALLTIHEKLQEHGQVLADTHHYYVPGGLSGPADTRFELRIYNPGELEQFRGDTRYGEALIFDEDTPDMLAAAAIRDGEILGMAGTTADSPRLWQVGVNVNETGRGLGVGSLVTAALKEEVLNRGFVPYYGTVESHIKSQRTAIRAGFLPAFYELFSAPAG